MLHSTFDSHAGESRLIKLDPRAKLVGLLTLTIATALLTRSDAVVVSLALALVISAVSGVPGRHVGKRLLHLLPFAGLAFFSILPFSGIGAASVLFTRVVACGTYLVVLSSVTPFFDLIRALQFFHFPSILTQMLILLYRYLFVFREESVRMSVARKARRYEGGRSLLNKRALQVVASSAGMILYRAYHRGVAVNRALLARRYEGKVRTLTEFRIRTPDIAFLAGSGTLVLLFLLIQMGVVG